MSILFQFGALFSKTSNIAEAIAKTPGSPEHTTKTTLPASAKVKACFARSASTLLSDGCNFKPFLGAILSTYEKYPITSVAKSIAFDT